MSVVVAAALALATGTAACGTGSAPPAADDPAPVEAAAAAVGAALGAAAAAVPTPRPTPTVDPGTLPQTRDEPSTTDPAFAAGVRGLFAAVQSGQPAPGRPLFFPLPAYRQVKAITNPASDWQTRLVGFYNLDIGAIHASLGPGAASARLLGVSVPAGRAGWIDPGVEYNKIGYWRVYGTRVRYELGGQERSFGVCSMISWRGRWYVVHLGPIVGRQPGVGALCNE